jgi:uncharacterized protein (DUF1778 family)
VPQAARKLKTPLRTKEDRLVARVSRSDKELIERGAEVAGVSVANFVISHARKAAETLIQEDRLTAEESRKVMDALLAPPAPPTAAAKKALARYRQTVLSDVNPASRG